MRFLQIALVLGILAISIPASAQNRATASVRPARGHISGVVTTDREGKSPARRAVVTLRGEQTGETVTTTDAEGRFSFDRVAADRFTIIASRPSYISATFGAKKPGGQGVPLVLADGERRNIWLWLAKGAVISGRVIAPDGLPATGVTVAALAPVIANGERVLLASATTPGAVVDDEGRFRIYGLRPGAYVVTVRPASTAIRGFAVGNADDVQRRVVTYSHVFFPGTTDAADARRVQVDIGEEVGGVDIPLRLVPAAGIAGVVRIDGDSPLPTGTRLVLTRAVRGLAPHDGGEVVNVDAAGRFRVPPLAPGRYVIRLVNLTLTPSTAHLGEKPRVYWGRVEVDVNGEDVEDVVLQLHRGLDLPGQLVTEAPADVPPLDLSAFTLSLEGITVDGIRPASPATVRPDAAGRFTLTGVAPGRYRVHASLPPLSGRTFGWFMTSVSFDGAVLNGDILEISETLRAGSLSLKVTTSPSRVLGRLMLDQDVPASGFTIVAFPVEESIWVMQSRNIQHVRPATDGTFTFINLPVGEFYLCALEELTPSDLGDPDFLRGLLPGAVRVTVKEAEGVPLTLKIAR
jgi:hypothetical protein